jgi:hypothetical protein
MLNKICIMTAKTRAMALEGANTTSPYCRAVIVHLRFLPDPKIDHEKSTITPVYFNKTKLHSETIHATSIVNLDNFAMVFALPSGRFYLIRKLRAVYRDSAIYTTSSRHGNSCPHTGTEQKHTPALISRQLTKQ